MFHVSISWQQTVSKTGGWTENFWNSLASRDAVVARTRALIDAFYAARGNPVFAPRFRVSEVGVFRSGKTYRTQQVPSSSVGPDTAADYPTTKVQVNMLSSTKFTTQWFGGLRDRDIASGGFWQPQGTSVNFYASVKTILTTGTNGWSIYVLDPASVLFPIVAFNPTTGVVTTVGANLVSQDKVRVKGVRGVTSANGIWTVTKLADQSYQLQGWVASTDTFQKSNATIRKQTYVGQSIVDIEYVQSTAHRVGKPGGLLGGRRKRRKT